MPVWAVASFASISCAVAEVFAIRLTLAYAVRGHWGLGFTSLAIGVVALLVIAVVLVVLTSVLRSIDRRTR